jgi:hypothetical protein
MIPPMIFRIRIHEEGRKKLSLCLPIFLIWILLLVIFLLLLPLIILFGLVFMIAGRGCLVFRIWPLIWQLIASIRGLRVHVTSEDSEVLISFV